MILLRWDTLLPSAAMVRTVIKLYNNSKVRFGPPEETHHIHGSPVYYEGPSGKFIYLWGENDHLRAFRFDGSKFDDKHYMESHMRIAHGMPGGMLSISADGSKAGTAIIWATHPFSATKQDVDATNQVVTGIMRAFDASDLNKQLWSTQVNARQDNFGSLSKFTPPTIANGRVYFSYLLR